ncbi:MAG: DUF1015 domain-containing protein [Oscillospiraceae bacterium]|jgi:uncharacterized protein (DUF1015 family)|nr:DUF1015 domain-containing protein [Oscillospiraceae bacterium]
MAEIKGFKGSRFSEKAGAIEELTCPPYDIISEEQRLAFIEKNSSNIIRLELPKGENPYEEAGLVLQKWIDDGILIEEAAESIYIYEEEFVARGQRSSIKGFICRVKLVEFSKGVVLPHEETLSKAKEDRFNLMKATHSNFSQIYSLYMDDGGKTRPKIDTLSAGKPDIEMTDEGGVIHRLWIVSDEEAIAAVAKDFEARKLFIADGHHRYETGVNYSKYCKENGISKEGDNSDYIMMMLVEMENEGLVVFPTHRLIRNLEGFDKDAVISKSKEYFTVTEHTGADGIEPALDELYAQNKKAFAMYCKGGKWNLFVLNDIKSMEEALPDCSDALRGLDVSVLHSLVLDRVLGIDKANMASQINLTYTRVFEEAISKVDSGEFQCSFILNPTRVEEIRDVAAAGEKMPQKSTYFYPKLITGLVINKF